MQRLPTDPEYKKVTANAVHEFRGVGPNEKIHLPELPENRKCTDVFCLGFLVVVLCGWIAFSVYIGTHSDMRFILSGEDDCGNICGVDNIKSNVHLYRRENCTKEDFTDFPILLYEKWNSTSSEKKCIRADDCKDGKILHNRHCYPKETKINSLPGIYKISWVSIGLICLLSITLNILVIVCLRLNARISSLTLGILDFLTLCVICGLLWYFAMTYNKIVLIVVAVIITLVILILAIATYLLRKKLQLIFRIYEETMEAIFNSPIILIIPLLSVIFNLLLDITCSYMIILAVSIDYVRPSLVLMSIYILVMLVVYYWMYHFTTGCQCTVVAGTIAFHYFSRNKSELKSPILKSSQMLVRYHLGSVALGSIIITIISIIEDFADCASNLDSTYVVKVVVCLCMCLLSCLEVFVRYLSKKSYIMMVIHGQNFCKSAVRAVKLMWHFLLDLIATDVIGGLAVDAGACCCVLIPVIIGFFVAWSLTDELDVFFGITMALGFILAAIITFYYCSLMNVALETTFLSFCEDKLLNDGSPQRPYFMSERLREIVEDSWKTIEKKREKQEEEIRRETEERRN